MSDEPAFYGHLTFNAPLSDGRADAIAARLAAAAPATVLDVGCGWGELLLRVLAAAPGARGTGVDTDDRVLARGRDAAVDRGLVGRVAFDNIAGRDLSEPADLVMCVGSTHAFGDTPDALAALQKLVRPGGRLLFGDGIWQERGPVDRGLVWDDVLAQPDLGGLVDLAVDSGFRPLWVEAADADEWDAFESGFLADSEEWLMTHADHPDAPKIRAQADEHRRRWLHGYRNGLGFGYLTLGVPVG